MSTKEDGIAKCSQSYNTFGSRPPVKASTLGSKLKPKQGSIQIKRSGNPADSTTGKENIVNLHNKGNFWSYF